MRGPTGRVQDYQRSAAAYGPGQRPSVEDELKHWAEGWEKLANDKKK